uniref:Potassium channel toxin kappa-KTx 2.9 n=1 Tax=Pandinus imperator TaxID=55084 RepID=KKX29_PANIM|nr:RecName: Full=Potassium channel toxin kappa-KTx 2.9; AltName: Full=Potassium channel-blocking toxin 6; Short=Pi6 [Pandinus imperator]7ZRU_A Chain A, Potassium channel toxin kappa-KTx 2.9 [Pandinus imperator]
VDACYEACMHHHMNSDDCIEACKNPVPP